MIVWQLFFPSSSHILCCLHEITYKRKPHHKIGGGGAGGQYCKVHFNCLINLQSAALPSYWFRYGEPASQAACNVTKVHSYNDRRMVFLFQSLSLSLSLSLTHTHIHTHIHKHTHKCTEGSSVCIFIFIFILFFYVAVYLTPLSKISLGFLVLFFHLKIKFSSCCQIRYDVIFIRGYCFQYYLL